MDKPVRSISQPSKNGPESAQYGLYDMETNTFYPFSPQLAALISPEVLLATFAGIKPGNSSGK